MPVTLDRQKKRLSAMHFDETAPRDNACCNPGTVVSGGRFGPAKGQFITRSQIHGWRTDSRPKLRVERTQGGHAVMAESGPFVQAEFAADRLRSREAGGNSTPGALGDSLD